MARNNQFSRGTDDTDLTQVVIISVNRNKTDIAWHGNVCRDDKKGGTPKRLRRCATLFYICGILPLFLSQTYLATEVAEPEHVDVIYKHHSHGITYAEGRVVYDESHKQRQSGSAHYAEVDNA